MQATASLRVKTRRGVGFQIPDDLAKPLQAFGKACGMSGAQIVRIGLHYMAKKLTDGEIVIVNGEAVPASGGKPI